MEVAVPWEQHLYARGVSAGAAGSRSHMPQRRSWLPQLRPSTAKNEIISKSIHNAALFHSFLWLINVPLHIYTTSFFIHSPVDRRLGCFHVLAIVNSAAMNIGVYVSFWIIVFSRYVPRSGIPRSYTLTVCQSMIRLNPLLLYSPLPSLFPLVATSLFISVSLLHFVILTS